MRTIPLLPLLALTAAAPFPQLLTPNDIVEKSPASAWRTIPADDLMVIELANGGRVVVQLAPAFAPVHVANIKGLVRDGYWQGATVYRVQDNYVAQWGQNDLKKPPKGIVPNPPPEYTRSLKGLSITPLGSPDPYAPGAGFADGWPVAYSIKGRWADLTHCYGSVGVGRDVSPNTGSGGELYAVIGHGPRQLDRNIALVGRVVDGIDRFSTLPRGTEALGFYKDKAQYVPIAGVRLASDMPVGNRPSYQVMDTGSPTFAHYLKVRANRHDAFYDHPAGGVDLCNVQVPVRKKV
jgi:peptidylprolyl isomerase